MEDDGRNQFIYSSFLILIRAAGGLDAAGRRREEERGNKLITAGLIATTVLS